MNCYQKTSVKLPVRSARVKAFISHLRKEEVKENFFESVVEQTSPWEFLLAKSTNTSQSVNTAKLSRDFVCLRESLYDNNPEMKLMAAESVLLQNINRAVGFKLY